MSQPEHPSADRISDLLAGSLPAAEAMSVNAHLSGCSACADVRADLLEVTATLAAEGATDWPMPADVAAGLDAALAQAAAQRAAVEEAAVEGSAGAGATIEAPPAAGRSAGSHRRLQWLAGAAAAVLVVGVGFAGIQAISDNGGNTSSRASSGAEHSAGQGSSGHSDKLGGNAPVAIPPPGSAGAGHIVHSLTTSEVPARARRLADHAATGNAAHTGRCAAPTGGPAAVVFWHGKPAVLALRTTSRTATIVDCKTGQKSLFVTHY